ncbi:tRNA dihydrouridine synthase [Methyloterricola oryzae]|uniref:tRNA dihydrouridine synthase n=1 Tax=Methyloterricola oryzae TaxID=1495050 RepID=UPI000ADE783A|nr:tRNA-dihydrouridine synthase [Methyloterricola oryzae]
MSEVSQAQTAAVPRIYLAPMEGLLDFTLRDVLTRVGGMDLCVTEFVRVSGSVLPDRCFQRIAPELDQGGMTAAGVPVRVQLLGSDPDLMARNAARLARLRPVGIDLNFGCPAKTVNRHCGGAILLREPERLRAIVSAVRRALPNDVRLSAKMRLGYEDKGKALDCARAIADGGAEELVVHARTKSEGYRPPAHWDWIARVQSELSIPVMANGEVWSLEDYRRCREISGVIDVMLGRGMVSNPALARSIRAGEDCRLPWGEVVDLLRVFWDALATRTSPKGRCGRIKQWLVYLRLTYPEAQMAFASVRALTTPEALERSLFNAPGKS